MLDGRLFYVQNDMVEAPEEPVAVARSLGIMAAETESPTGMFPCPYCDVDIPMLLSEDGEPHRCWGLATPGVTTKLGEGHYALVLEASPEKIIYQSITQSGSVIVEETPEQFISSLPK